MKPQCEILDYVGNAGRHTLICTTDILGGNYPPPVRELARQLVKEGIEDPTEALEEAKARLDDERERERLKEAGRRARLRAKAKYQQQDVCPFSVLGVAPPMKKSGNPSTLKQCELLAKFGVDATNMSGSEATKLQRTIFARMNAGKCTLKQARVLKKWGYDTDVSMEEASRILDGLASNGWKQRTA